MNTKIQTQPKNPIQAVTHPDPYLYYRELVETRPLYYDEELKLWVATSAEAVKAVLSSPLCRVRPVSEPVPKALLNSSAGSIFQHLVRMNDGQHHRPVKQAVTTTLAGVSTSQRPQQLSQCSEKWSHTLFAMLNLEDDLAQLSEFACKLPIYVMGDLLGIPDDDFDLLAEWVSDFVRCLSPLSSLEQIERGKSAASCLLDLFNSLLAVQHAQQPIGLLGHLSQHGGTLSPQVVIANGIGFLLQTYEATAGLIGNTLITLARHVDVLEQVKKDAHLLPMLIQEVLRFDAPVQNTRRFIAEDRIVGGQEMNAGEAVLVILAAANHDPAANPQPERFEMRRADRQIFTFGEGIHTCPGQVIAAQIAQAGVGVVLHSGLDIPKLLDGFTYQESTNVRLPLFMNERN